MSYGPARAPDSSTVNSSRAFVALLEREGHDFARHEDFEAAFQFERRVQDMAEPHSTVDAGPASKVLDEIQSLTRRALNRA